MKDINESLETMNEGEKQLYFICKKYEAQGYVLIPNALFPRPGGGTNQLDLIMISNKGVFVFEMKDFKGYITGDEYHTDWVQHLGTERRKKKYKFRNPVKQNENHIKTIKTLMSEKGMHLPIYNVVVFGLNSTLGHVSSSSDVVKLDGVDACIAKYPMLAIGEADVREIAEAISAYDIDSPLAREEHLKYIDQLKTKENKRAKQTIHGTSDKKRGNNRSKLDFKGTIALILLILGLIMPISFLTKLVLFIGIYGMYKLKHIDNRRWFRASIGLFVFTLLLGGWLNMRSSNIFQSSKTESVYQISTQKSKVAKVIETEKPSTQPSVKTEKIDPKKTIEIAEDSGFDEYIGLGVAIEVVEKLAGVPDKVEDNKYYYGRSTIRFGDVGTVVGWNIYDNILYQLFPQAIENAEPIYFGSSKFDVLAAVGAPKHYDDDSLYCWKYSNGSVWFNEEGEVVGWHNLSNALTNGLHKPVENADPFFIGSSKDDVLQSLGSPTYIDYKIPNRWNYSNAYVEFDEEDKVVGWYNASNKLTGLRSRVDGAANIQLGSTKEMVIDAIGLPSIYNRDSKYMFTYSTSSISFNEDDMVTGWVNLNGKFSHAFADQIPGADVIDIGSSSDDVVKRVGMPYIVKSEEPQKWFYGNNYIIFDQEWNVESWYLYNSAMKVDFVESE